MTKEEALKLAHEALKKFHYAMIDAGVLDRQEVLNEGFTAATAIKEALAQPEQDWRNAALRIGEDLSSVGPEGYYNMTAQQWLDWAMEQKPRGNNSLAQPEQEPVAWQTMEAKYPTLEKLDIRMGDGSILCNLWPQSDGDLWWEGSGTGEKFIDPKYANVTHWRVHSDITPPQRKWVGLTVEDVHDCLKGLPTQSIEVYARSVEAKLKQKNGYAEENT